MVTNLKSKFQQEFRQSPIKMIVVLIALGTVINWLATDTLRRYDEDTVSDAERAEQAEYEKYCGEQPPTNSMIEREVNHRQCLRLMEKRFSSN